MPQAGWLPYINGLLSGLYGQGAGQEWERDAVFLFYTSVYMCLYRNVHVSTCVLMKALPCIYVCHHAWCFFFFYEGSGD